MRDDLRNHGLMSVSTSTPVPTVVPINGQDTVHGILNDNVVAFDPVHIKAPATNAFTKAANPAVLPTGAVNRICYSPDKVYMAIMQSGGSRIGIYKKVAGVYNKIANPDILPASDPTYAEFSPDGNYLAVSLFSAPYLHIYKRTGDAFNKLANPANLPTDIAFDVSWDPTSTYLAVAYASTPAFIVYKRTADVFAKLANPAEVPTYGSGNAIAWSPDGNYLAVGMSQLSFQWIYKRVGDVLTKLNTNSIVLSGSIMDLAWSPDSTYLVTGGSSSPHLNFLKRTGDTFAKLASPMNLPNAAVSALEFSHDNAYLVVGMAIAPYTMLYDHAGDSFTEAGNAPPAKTIFNVTTYGAVADGVTDCRDAINNCFTAASAANGIVYFPPHSLPYLIGSYIYGLDNVEVWGYGATIFKASTPIVSDIIYRASSYYVNNMIIKGLTLKSASDRVGVGEYDGTMISNVEGINLSGCDNLVLKDVCMDQMLMGLRFQTPASGYNQNILVDNLQVKNSRNGIQAADTKAMNVINSSFDNSGGNNKLLHNIYMRYGTSDIHFNNCKFMNSGGGAIHLYTSSSPAPTDMSFDNCEIDECRAAIYLYSGTSNIRFNNIKVKRAGGLFKVNSASNIVVNGLDASLFSPDKYEVNFIKATTWTNSQINHCKIDAATMGGDVIELVSGCAGLTMVNFTGINMGGRDFTSVSTPITTLTNRNLSLGNNLTNHYTLTGTSSPTIPTPPPIPDRVFPALTSAPSGIEFNSDSTEIAYGLSLTPFMALYTHDYLNQVFKTIDIADLVGALGAGYVKEAGLVGSIAEVTRIFK